jgi:hypothetical protein
VIVLPDGCGLTNNEAACNQSGNDFFIPVRMLLNFWIFDKNTVSEYAQHGL